MSGETEVADVLQKIGAQDAVLAGEAIDFDFADRRAIGEIVEWLAGRGLRVEMNFRRAVVALREQRDALAVSGFDDL